MPLSKYKLVSCVVILAAIFLIYEFIQIGYQYPKTLVTLQQLELRNTRLDYHHGNKEATFNSTDVNDSNQYMDTVAEVNLTEDGFICVNESQLRQEFIRTHDIQNVHKMEQLKSSVHQPAIRDVPLEDMHLYDPPQIDEPPDSDESQPKVPGFEKREGSKHVVRKVKSGSKRPVKLSSSLLKLEVYPMQQNSDLLVERKFPQWQPSDKLKNYTRYLEVALNGSNSQITRLSMSADIIARGMFQQAQMEQFCRKHQLKSNLPRSPTDLDTLFQHLLYDDSKRIVFCYVPKNGCSNMKRLLLILNGILPPESVHKRPPEDVLKKVHSFRTLSPEDALYKLKNYIKVVTVRNPMERLLSAYRNKIEPPLDWENRHHFPDTVKTYILQHYRKIPFRAWLDGSGNETQDISPSFSEFSHFMTLFKLTDYNEHFKTVLDLCYPCAVHYDFYANFKSLDYDIYALMDYLDIPMEYYPQLISHRRTPTTLYMDGYFSGLSHVEKQKLFNVFSNELDFYYTLHPEERGMHMSL